VAELRFSVAGNPPAKNEAPSMLGPGHSQSSRVIALLEAARDAILEAGIEPFTGPVGLDVVLFDDGSDRGDATNYLGGIGDTLEDKARRGPLDHLGTLVAVHVYRNDRQIREVHFRTERSERATYVVRVYALPDHAVSAGGTQRE
jgi:hypothetical protein